MGSVLPDVTRGSAKKSSYLFAAVTLFTAGAVGGIIDVIGSGSILGTIAQVVGYCGAGYNFCRWRDS